MRSLPALLLLVPACASPPSLRPSGTELGGGPVVLPAALHDGYFLLRAEVNGRGPVLLMLDTGSDCMIVSRELAAELPAHAVPGRSTVRGAIGDVTTADSMLRVDRLALGEAAFTGFCALVMEVGPLSSALGRPIDGIVGLCVFADCLLTLDYPERQVRVSRGALPPADGREILALRRGRVAEVGATLGGTPIAVKIDSGFGREVGLRGADGIDFLRGPTAGPEVATITGTHARQEGRLDSDLRLGRHVFRRPRATIHGGDPKIGSRLLRRFSITFDQRGGRVRLEDAGAASGRAP